jgi:hypothetical protein
LPGVDFATRDSLTAQLGALGVVPGGVLLAHSSYKSLGQVIGGPQAVVEALLAAAGTVVVPTHTPEISDPATWSNPPVPERWWEPIRQESPGFDPARTPASKWMGRLSELVRTWPGARRSDHPQVSFAAVGPRAAEIVDRHSLTDGLGEESPLGAVYRLDGPAPAFHRLGGARLGLDDVDRGGRGRERLRRPGRRLRGDRRRHAGTGRGSGRPADVAAGGGRLRHRVDHGPPAGLVLTGRALGAGNSQAADDRHLLAGELAGQQRHGPGDRRHPDTAGVPPVLVG